MGKYDHDYPFDIYTNEYFVSSGSNPGPKKYGLAYDKKIIKIQDEFAALCYITGVAKNYSEVEQLLGLKNKQSLIFPGELAARYHRGQLPENWVGLYDSVYRDGWNYHHLLDLLQKDKNYTKPNGVIDFGAGRGCLSSMFSHLGSKVGYVDPIGLFPNDMLNQENIEQYAFFGDINDEDIDQYQSIVFCSAIEHIPVNVSHAVIERCKGKKLVIVNTISYHPIQESGRDHCTLIDDNFYNVLTDKVSKVLYREGSHFVAII